VGVDVAIVGAGPAGATLAALLAWRGVRVVVLERDGFPRDKLCGEFLSYDALPVLEALGAVEELDRAGSPRIERCRVVSSRHEYEFELPHAARGVSRQFFDALLVRIARAKGAEVRERHAVTDLREISASVVVGAWGRWGRFDQQLKREFVRDRAHRNFGFKRHYRGRPPEGVIELYSFRRGYLGVSAVEDGITNICGLVHASRLSGHKGRWDSFIASLRAEESTVEALYSRYTPAQDGYLSSEPIIFRARAAVENGIFMIGDASGILDPLTGNGMAMAVQSALLAAPLLLRLLEQPSRRPEIEEAYRRTHRRSFASRIAWSRSAAMLLSRPRLLDGVLAAVRVKAIGELVARRTRASRDEVARVADTWFH
jgi:flavin-dependent dehydrogenase